MILDVNGQPYKQQESLLPTTGRNPCPRCGSIMSRNVHKGFARTWRLTCQDCGYEIATGRGEIPEGV